MPRQSRRDARTHTGTLVVLLWCRCLFPGSRRHALAWLPKVAGAGRRGQSGRLARQTPIGEAPLRRQRHGHCQPQSSPQSQQAHRALWHRG